MISNNNFLSSPSITGRKKKGKTPQNAPNSIRTRGWVRFVEAISEGPIEGLIDGGKSIYFDQTPLIAPDGTTNFENITWEFHNGTPDDGHFNGVNAVETPVDVNVQAKANALPVTRTIVEQNADAVRVILRVNSLFHQNDKGELHPTSLSYAIEVRGNGGTWQRAVYNSIREKSTSPFQIAHRVELPTGGSPWEIRVIRHTPDKPTTDDKLQNDLFFERYVILVEGKFTYPHTAVIGMEANAEDLGNSVPPRSYHVKGLQIQVPSNYDPVKRTYTGIWDGTFKIAWSNNPAWIFYDLITNDRYGLGEFVSPTIVDKWSLYTIAQYCDQLVPSGYKNTDTGEDIYEPRFTFNGVINSRDEAYFVLQTITKAWRGMAYWALGQVFATSDMPGDPIKLVTPANVVKGEFEYSGTALKARHSVIMVKWNDPKDFYAPATEAVIDDQLLAKYGWREKSLQLQGCTSRGLAHRYGKWILDSEQHETETVTYQAGWDHADVRPGHIIAISDPNKANIRAGGRIKSHNDTTIVLDSDFEANTGEQYQLMLTMPDGSLETKPIAAFQNKHTVILNEMFSQTAVENAVWSIKGTDIHPRLFRVLAIKEEEPNIFTITALFHDPQKYDRIEHGIIFEPLPYDRPSNIIEPPTNLSVKETGYTSNGQSYQILTVSWSPPEVSVARGYIVNVDTPSGNHVTLGITQDLSKEFTNSETGTYKFYVESVSYAGVTSNPAEIEYEALGSSGFPLPAITSLELVDNPGSTEFTGRDLNFRWTNNFAQSMEAIPTSDPSPHYLNNTVKIYNNQTNQLLREEKVTNNVYAYYYEANEADNIALGNASACRQIRVEVLLHDVFGRTSSPAIVIFNNPPPQAIAPTALVNAGTIYLYYEQPPDTDFVGVLVYCNKSAGINVTTATPKYDGVANPVIILGEESTTYYIKIAGYDAFGKDGLNYSSEITVTTLFNIDIVPPAKPTGLQVSSSLNGESARVVVTWNANTEDDLAGYDLQIKQGFGNWVSFLQTSNVYEFDSLPNVSYQARVRSRDKMGNTSAYTNGVSHLTAKDTTPPATPMNLQATGGFGIIWLTWNKNTESDFSHYEIFEANNATPTPITTTNAQYATAANSFVRSGLVNNQKRYFWVRAIDTSGNKSGWVAASATTAANPGITEADLQGMITNTSFAEGLVGIEVLPSLPDTGNSEGRVVLNTTDGKIYRFINGAWTAATFAQDIQGKLAASSIAIGDFTNIIDNGWATGDISGWSLEDSTYSLPIPVANADYYGYTVTGTGRIAASSKSVPVKSGEIYHIGAWVRNTETNYAAWIGVGAAKPDGAIIWADMFSTDVKNQWVYLNGKYTVPDETENIFIYLFTNRPFGATGSPTHWSKPLMRRAVSEELLVDGVIKTAHIANNAITTTEIAPGAIQAPQIAANAIVAGKISANAVTAATIAAEAITANKIATNAITTNKIAAGAITAHKIAAGAITADQIAANAITTGKIAANAITTGKIAAGAIGANQIAAQAISAKHLTIGDFTNIIDRGWSSGDASGWQMLGNPFGLPTPAVNEDWYGWTLTSVVANGALSNPVPVKEDEIYYFGVWVYAHSNAPTVRLHIRATKMDNTQTGVHVASSGIKNQWVYLSGKYTVPHGAKVIQVRLMADHPTGDTIKTVKWAKPLMRRAVSGELLVDGAIKANHLSTENLITSSAQIKNAIITDAKIVDLSAAKIKANTVLADTIKVGNTNLATIRNQASNPAPQINSGSTLIDPGKILISGATRLSDWRLGGDNTKIDGGHIAANTIAANKLTIGTRGIYLDGVTFEHNKPAINCVAWTSGAIRFINDAGITQSVLIVANYTLWQGDRIYIYWIKGNTAFNITTNLNVASQPNHVILATYNGGAVLYANYGRTVIDGSHIKTGTIQAQQIHAGAIGAGQIAANAISAGHIQANAIVGSKIAAEAITANKIATNAITTNKIAANAITTDKMAAGSIHGNRISAGTLDADRISAGTITATRIQAKTIIADNIGDNEITQRLSTYTGFVSSPVQLTLNIHTGFCVILLAANCWKTTTGTSIWITIHKDGSFMRNMLDIAVSHHSNVVGNEVFLDTANIGWHTYKFEVRCSNPNNVGNVEFYASIVNFKK